MYAAPVITYVICSSGVRSLQDSITEGINTYRVKVIRLKDRNADRILERLAGKSEDELNREEMIPVLLTPLMNSEHTIQNRILGSIRILKKAEAVFSDQEIRRMEAILYILAAKFLNESELKMIKEEMAMTKLGQMIWDDAVKQGRARRRPGPSIGAVQPSDFIACADDRSDQIIKMPRSGIQGRTV